MRSSLKEPLPLLVDSGEDGADCNVADQKTPAADEPTEIWMNMGERVPLWQLDIGEVTGHNLETRGREEVNRLLQAGWRLLHIYTLKYREDDVWRERPMAVLGRPRDRQQNLEAKQRGTHGDTATDYVAERSLVTHREGVDRCRGRQAQSV
jgi:hypothetical protein